MPEVITQKGLVIRETAYGEADSLIDILTDSGIRTVRVRGARKPNSKYAAAVQLFAYSEFCMRESKGKWYLDSAVSQNLFYNLRTDLNALALAAYFADLVRLVSTAQHQPDVLRLFLICLHYLSEKLRGIPQIKAVFELRLLADSGMMPNLVCCPICMQFMPAHPILRIEHADMLCGDCYGQPGLSDLSVTQETLLAVRHVIYSDLDKVLRFQVRGNSLRLFTQYAERYLIYQLGYRVPSLDFYYDIVGNQLEENPS